MGEYMNDEYLCHKCHIIFKIYSVNGTSYCISQPNSKYRIEVNRPKAVCPKCKQESPYNIRIESD